MNYRNRVGKVGSGFTLVEMLVVLAVIGVIGAAGMFVVGTRDGGAEVKLRQDVANLNKAVKVYLASGGTIDAKWGAPQVVAALKRQAANSGEKRLVGLSGSLIDPRMGVELESEKEAASGRPKALWRPDKQRFVVVKDERPGVREFVLDNRYIPSEDGEDGRETSMLYAKKGSWVWDYQDRTNERPPPADPPALGLVSGPNPPPVVWPPPQVLQPPVFSLPPGNYPYTDFDLPVALDASHNVPGTYEIYYSINSSPFTIYPGGLVAIPRGATVMTFAKSIDPDRYADSSSATATYDPEPVPLAPPTIETDYAFFDLGVHPQVAVSISDANDAALPYVVRYRVEGGAWQDYQGPFVLDADDHRYGAFVEAAAFGLESWVLDSDSDSTLLKYKLQPPEFAVTNEEDIEAIVTISNPNDQLVSSLRFRSMTLPSSAYSSEAAYASPLVFKGEDYPDGVRVASRVVTEAERFIDSDEAAVEVYLVDPDDWEIEGVSDGSFGDPVGGSDLVVSFGNENALFTWGEGIAPAYTPSAVSFSGVEFAGIEPGDVFKVGEISYFNGTISGGTGAEGVSFAVEIGFNNSRSVSFEIPIELVNVPNSNRSAAEAADYLRIPNQELVQDIRLYGKDYRVAIAFGGSQQTEGNTSLTEFHVWEDATATADVFAAILHQNASTNGVLGWMRGHINQYYAREGGNGTNGGNPGGGGKP